MTTTSVSELEQVLADVDFICTCALPECRECAARGELQHILCDYMPKLLSLVSIARTACVMHTVALKQDNPLITQLAFVGLRDSLVKLDPNIFAEPEEEDNA